MTALPSWNMERGYLQTAWNLWDIKLVCVWCALDAPRDRFLTDISQRSSRNFAMANSTNVKVNGHTEDVLIACVFHSCLLGTTLNLFPTSRILGSKGAGKSSVRIICHLACWNWFRSNHSSSNTLLGTLVLISEMKFKLFVVPISIRVVVVSCSWIHKGSMI